MACDIDDREGESPSPMEPRLGRMFHSSATGRRRGRIFLRPSVFVKRFTHEMTLREVPAVRRGRPGALQPTEPRSRAQPGCATRIGIETVGFSSFAGASAGAASGPQPEPRRCLMGHHDSPAAPLLTGIQLPAVGGRPVEDPVPHRVLRTQKFPSGPFSAAITRRACRPGAKRGLSPASS